MTGLGLVARKVIGLLVGLQLALLPLGGCQVLLGPLDPTAPVANQYPPQPLELATLATCSAGEPLARALSQAYSANSDDQIPVSLNVIVSSSSLVAEWVRAGRADLGILAVAGSASQEMTGSALAGLDAHPLAADALAIIVHQSNPLAGIARDDLRALYAGEIADWEILGGQQGAPELVSRESGAVSRTAFVERIMGGAALSSTTALIPRDDAIVDWVAAHPLAVSYVASVLVDQRVVAISLDGVEPTPDQVQAGRYPLVQSLVLVSGADGQATSAALAAFLQTRQGRRLVQGLGLVPLDS